MSKLTGKYYKENNSKEIFIEKEELKKDITREEKIDTIEKALDEKRVREIQNLELQIEKDRLCAHMKQVDAINDILSSTSKNKTGCPQQNKTASLKECVQEDVAKKDCSKEVDAKEINFIECPVKNKLPKIFKGKKKKIYLTLMWIIIIVLAVGWSPSGSVYKQIQDGYLELLVDFFKMGLFALAGYFTYKVVKDNE